MSKSNYNNAITSENNVFDILKKYTDRIEGSKLFDDVDIYASAESTFYERAVEEFWRDPIGGFSK